MVKKLLDRLQRRQRALEQALSADTAQAASTAPDPEAQARAERIEMLIGHAQLLEDQEQLVDAEALLRQVLALDPEHAAAKLNLGNVLLRMGHDEAAERFYLDVALSGKHAYAAQLNLGNLELQRGKPEQALVHYRRAASLRPDLADPLLGTGLALEQQARVTEAEATYRQALPLESEPGPVLFNLVQLLRKQQRQADALALLQPHLARPEAPDGLKALAAELAAISAPSGAV